MKIFNKNGKGKEESIRYKEITRINILTVNELHTNLSTLSTPKNKYIFDKLQNIFNTLYIR